MSRPTTIHLWAGPFLLLSLLSACQAPPSPGPASIGSTATTPTDVAVMEACRQRANEIYDRQNRATIYAPQSGVNNPLSGSYGADGTTRGLSAQFAHQRMIQDCIRTANVTSSRADVVVDVTGTKPPTAPTKAPPPTAKPR